MAQGPNDPQGPFLYQEDGKTYASLPAEMLQNIQKSPLFDKLQKDCKAERVEIPKTIMANNPVAHMLTPQEYIQQVEAGIMPQIRQLSDDERTGQKEGRDQVFNDGVSGCKASAPAYYDTTTKTQVSNVALQTDTCNMLYVTQKHFDCVHYCYHAKFTSAAVRPNARSPANCEKPSISGNTTQGRRTLAAHFNLAVLEDQKDLHISPDAQKPVVTTQDAEQSASAP